MQEGDNVEVEGVLSRLTPGERGSALALYRLDEAYRIETCPLLENGLIN